MNSDGISCAVGPGEGSVVVLEAAGGNVAFLSE